MTNGKQTVDELVAGGLRYKTSYFGKQAWHEVPSEVQRIIQAADTYADFTMGGAEVPYLQWARGATILGNDRCYYAYTAAEAGMRSRFMSDDITTIRNVFDVRPVHRGYLTRMDPIAGIPLEVRMYVDSMLNLWYGESWVKGTIGRTIGRIWTDKRRRWLQNPELGTTIGSFQEEVVKEAVECYRTTEIGNAAGGICNLRYMDALTAINSYVPRGQNNVAYVDPAWPWAPTYVKTEGENPYLFVTYQLSAVVAQMPIPHVPHFWETGDTNAAARIMSDVINWVASAFAKGWNTFIVSTQSTNFPDPELVSQYLYDHFGNATMYSRPTVGGNDNIPYTDIFIVVENAKSLPEVR